MATTVLSRTPSVGGDRDKWTFATWIKRSKINTNESIFGAFPYKFWCFSPILTLFSDVNFGVVL